MPTHNSITLPLLGTRPPPNDPPPAYPGLPNALPPPQTTTTTTTPIPTGNPRPPPPRAPLSLPLIQHLRQRRVVLASASPRRIQLLNMLLGPSHPKLEVHVSQFPETLDKSEHTPYSYVLATAHGKCLDVYTRLLLSEQDEKKKPSSTSKKSTDGRGGKKGLLDGKDGDEEEDDDEDDDDEEEEEEEEPAVIIAADTVIVRTPTGTILEKPTSRQNHITTLQQLIADGSHSVFTAVVCMAPRPDARFPGYRVRSKVVETVVTFDKTVTREMVEAYVDTREGVDKAGGYALQGLGAVLVEKVVGSWDNVVGLPLRETLKCLEGVVRVTGDGELDEESSDGEEEEELEE
ncbi:septum formation protein Maf [Peziza echinospora]|nr:septum formation protein Maf [Peziza echinospora]